MTSAPGRAMVISGISTAAVSDVAPRFFALVNCGVPFLYPRSPIKAATMCNVFSPCIRNSLYHIIGFFPNTLFVQYSIRCTIFPIFHVNIGAAFSCRDNAIRVFKCVLHFGNIRSFRHGMVRNSFNSVPLQDMFSLPCLNHNPESCHNDSGNFLYLRSVLFRNDSEINLVIHSEIPRADSFNQSC